MALHPGMGTHDPSSSGEPLTNYLGRFGASAEPKPIKGWERRLHNYLATRVMPIQWLTTDNQMKCVVCSVPPRAVYISFVSTHNLPTCDRHKDVLLRTLGEST